MAQSYGNSSTSPILAATDEITGLTIGDQLFGSSISATKPAETMTAGLTLSISLEGEVPQTIVLSNQTTAYNVAAEIQAKVRALIAAIGANQPAYNNFTALFDDAQDKYVLASGTAGSSTSSCSVTGGTAAVSLKLGIGNGGSEATASSRVITYTVYYRFSYSAGNSFGGTPIIVLGSEMMVPTSMAELQSIANARASEMKGVYAPSGIISESNKRSSTINGVVSL